MSETIAILGGRGMLGTDLAEHLRQRDFAVRVWDLPEWDITQSAHIRTALSGAQVVVNCAAYTNVDKAEDQSALAMAVNAEAVGELGRLVKARGLYLIHISTDFVFDGQGTHPYAETDTPHPINTYGASKLKGEQLLAETGCKHAVLRVEWSYGRHGVHFISKLLERARTGAHLKVVDDQFGAPTWTRDMAGAIYCLIQNRHEGLYHFANAGYASRYDVACFIARQLHLSNPITPCASDVFQVKAARPKNSRFDTAKIQAILDHPIRNWPTALAEYLAHEF